MCNDKGQKRRMAPKSSLQAHHESVIAAFCTCIAEACARCALLLIQTSKVTIRTLALLHVRFKETSRSSQSKNCNLHVSANRSHDWGNETVMRSVPSLTTSLHIMRHLRVQLVAASLDQSLLAEVRACSWRRALFEQERRNGMNAACLKFWAKHGDQAKLSLQPIVADLKCAGLRSSEHRHLSLNQFIRCTIHATSANHKI